MMCSSSDFIDDAGDLGEFSEKGSVPSTKNSTTRSQTDLASSNLEEIPACWRTSTSEIEFEARAVHSGLENTDMLATSCEHFDLV